MLLGLPQSLLHSLKMSYSKCRVITYKLTKQSETWLRLNFQQNYKQRNEFVLINDTSMNRVGMNLMINRLKINNGRIKYFRVVASPEAPLEKGRTRRDYSS